MRFKNSLDFFLWNITTYFVFFLLFWFLSSLSPSFPLSPLYLSFSFLLFPLSRMHFVRKLRDSLSLSLKTASCNNHSNRQSNPRTKFTFLSLVDSAVTLKSNCVFPILLSTWNNRIKSFSQRNNNGRKLFAAFFDFVFVFFPVILSSHWVSLNSVLLPSGDVIKIWE